MNHPTPVLSTDKLYVAHDQYVCNECAGMTAEYTGVTIGGYRLTTVTADVVVEWAGYDLGPLTCECRRLEAVLDDQQRLQIRPATLAPYPPATERSTPYETLPAFPVTAMTLHDVLEDIRLLLGGEHDVDGITATTAHHPAFDPQCAGPGGGAVLITFTDAAGRNRIAEVELTARWREDGCDHTQTRPGALGQECTGCGMLTSPNEVTARCPECGSPVTDETTYFGVHTDSCALVMCQCEHADHQHPSVSHPYLGTRAGARRAQHVGLVCDECATGHLADYLHTDNGGEEQSR